MIKLTNNQLQQFYFHFIMGQFTSGVKFSRVLTEIKDLDLYLDVDILLKSYLDCEQVWKDFE